MLVSDLVSVLAKLPSGEPWSSWFNGGGPDTRRDYEYCVVDGRFWPKRDSLVICRVSGYQPKSGFDCYNDRPGDYASLVLWRYSEESTNGPSS